LTTLAAASAERLRDLVGGIEVDEGRLHANLDLYHGLLAAEELGNALAGTQGRAEAHAIVEQLANRMRAEGGHLRDLAAADQRVASAIPPDRLAAIFRYQTPLAAAAAEARRLTAVLDRREHDQEDQP
jgi:3-carboxy-cis,cis-muconate cycloisomerase